MIYEPDYAKGKRRIAKPPPNKTGRIQNQEVLA